MLGEVAVLELELNQEQLETLRDAVEKDDVYQGIRDALRD
jgi:hypothetical protein